MLTTSEQIDQIAAALAGAQLVMDNAVKDATNPAFRSRYADLAAVRAAVNLPLAQAKIAVIQAPAVDRDGWVSVETRFVHASGQWVACSVTAGAKDRSPQAIGSTITYLRRYGLMALAGIAPFDDDGNAGTFGHRHEPEPAPRPRSRRPAAGEEEATAPPPVYRWTDAERAGFCAELSKLDANYDHVASWCESLGKPRPSGMTPDQRSALLSALLGPARSKFNAHVNAKESQ
jgi:hypothetical protein